MHHPIILNFNTFSISIFMLGFTVEVPLSLFVEDGCFLDAGCYEGAILIESEL